VELLLLPPLLQLAEIMRNLANNGVSIGSFRLIGNQYISGAGCPRGRPQGGQLPEARPLNINKIK